MREHDLEPVPGLPERLPPGERVLWQGRPRWRTLAKRVFHLPLLGFYFAALIAVRLVIAVQESAPLGRSLLEAAGLAALGAAAISVLALIAWVSARTTLYTITNRRVVMRIGMALSMTVNLPFRVVEAAAVRLETDGTGDIVLSLVPGERVGYLMLWPHARPWRFARAEPMLRSIGRASHVATMLSAALAAEVPGGVRHRAAAAEAGQPAARPEPAAA